MLCCKKRKHHKGQALVEIALVLPIILLLIFGIIEFGRIFNAYIIVYNASREGARYAAIGKKGSDVQTEVTERTASLVGGVTVKVNPQDTRTQGTEVQVTVKYDLSLITPIVGPLISSTKSLHIESTTAMRVE